MGHYIASLHPPTGNKTHFVRWFQTREKERARNSRRVNSATVLTGLVVADFFLFSFQRRVTIPSPVRFGLTAAVDLVGSTYEFLAPAIIVASPAQHVMWAAANSHQRWRQRNAVEGSTERRRQSSLDDYDDDAFERPPISCFSFFFFFDYDGASAHAHTNAHTHTHNTPRRSTHYSRRGGRAEEIGGPCARRCYPPRSIKQHPSHDVSRRRRR